MSRVLALVFVLLAGEYLRRTDDRDFAAFHRFQSGVCRILTADSGGVPLVPCFRGAKAEFLRTLDVFSLPATYDVEGVLLPRPFKIRRLGHFGFNVEKLAEGAEFYGNLLGFKISDTADFSRAPWYPKGATVQGGDGYFMRYGTDHHAMVLFNKRVMDQRADRKFAELDRANLHTPQAQHLVADGGKDTANLAVLPFFQHHFQLGALGMLLLDLQ